MPRGGHHKPEWSALLASFFEARRWNRDYHASISEAAGLDGQRIRRLLEQPPSTIARGRLLRIAAAMDLTDVERSRLEPAAGLPAGSLRATSAQPLQEAKASMRRAVILVTAPRNPERLIRSRLRSSAIRTGVVFGWHDVAIRITTPRNQSVLDFSDRLAESQALRRIETIVLRDDRTCYVDRDFDSAGLREDDYFWAIILVVPLSTPPRPRAGFVEAFVSAARAFRGGVHLLTAAEGVGRFDTVAEVLVAKPALLREYVRLAQQFSMESGRALHTVTYLATKWRQQPTTGPF